MTRTSKTQLTETAAVGARARRSVTVFAVTLAATTALFAACGTTPGQPATATLRLAPSTGTFATSTGWQVVLDEAVLVAGSLYFYAPTEDTMARLRRELAPVALAHGGHDPFGSRPVRLEWLGPVALDLLAAGQTDLGEMDGSVGASTEVTMSFEPLAGALLEPDAAARGHHVWIAGRATRTAAGADETIDFQGGFDFEAEGTENLIEAIEAPADVHTDGSWTLSVALSRWLDQAHFERLPASETGPRTITSSTQVGIAWELGVRDPAGYGLRYEPAVAP